MIVCTDNLYVYVLLVTTPRAFPYGQRLLEPVTTAIIHRVFDQPKLGLHSRTKVKEMSHIAQPGAPVGHRLFVGSSIGQLPMAKEGN